jgi:predicted RNA binding protein YcfA (HicA-like mRNA interferase family)
MRSYSRCAEIDGIVRRLLRSGWTFRRGGKHGRVTSPDGRAFVTVPTTPGDRRTPLNFMRDVRRCMAAGVSLHPFAEPPSPPPPSGRRQA